MTDILVQRSAIISDCGRYRYRLTRQWEPRLHSLGFIMLNPSTADGETDDATVRVCIGRAQRMGYGALHIYNLFAWRATHPEELRRCADPVGPLNDNHLVSALQPGRSFIAGWGEGGALNGRAAQVMALAKRNGIHLKCLGTTKAGHPRHPLRIPYSLAPVDLWER